MASRGRPSAVLVWFTLQGRVQMHGEIFYSKYWDQVKSGWTARTKMQGQIVLLILSHFVVKNKLISRWQMRSNNQTSWSQDAWGIQVHSEKRNLISLSFRNLYKSRFIRCTRGWSIWHFQSSFLLLFKTSITSSCIRDAQFIQLHGKMLPNR